MEIPDKEEFSKSFQIDEINKPIDESCQIIQQYTTE